MYCSRLYLTVALLISSTAYTQETDTPAPSSTITFDLGTKRLHAQLPPEVGDIRPDRPEHPTSFQATKGDPTGAYETYTIQIVSPDKKERDRLVDPTTGQLKDFTSVGQFMAGESQNKALHYEITAHPWTELPEALQTSSPEDRYLWLSSHLKRPESAQSAQADQQTIPKKEMLWRILLVNGQVIMAEREISPAFVRQHNVNPSNEAEWQFLKSITVETPGEAVP